MAGANKPSFRSPTSLSDVSQAASYWSERNGSKTYIRSSSSLLTRYVRTLHFILL